MSTHGRGRPRRTWQGPGGTPKFGTLRTRHDDSRRCPLDAIAHSAEETLRAHPDPALRLAELATLLGARIDRTLTPVRLRPILERHPESFRVLDALPGAWAVPGAGAADAGNGMQHTWVVVVGPPVPPPPEEDHTPANTHTALRLRESVRWLARGLDDRSRVDTSRWDVIARAERVTREIVLSRSG